MIFEHPWTTEFIREEPIQRVIRKYHLTTTRLGQCAMGLRDAQARRLHLKPTIIVTNDLRAARLLGRRCSGDHEHQRLEGTTP